MPQVGLLDPPCTGSIKVKHAWNSEDRSFEYIVKDDDKLTSTVILWLRALTVYRAKVGYERGLHVFELRAGPPGRGGHYAVVGSPHRTLCISVDISHLSET